LRLEDFATFAERTQASKRFIDNTWMPTRFKQIIAQMPAAIEPRTTNRDMLCWIPEIGTQSPGEDSIA
jgi:hypothetical protein